MVLEAPVPKTSGARPPNFGGPPIGTTFSNDPDDRDEMIVSLKDNVQRLVHQAEHSDRHNVPTFLRLLDQRRDWIKGELDVEGMLNEPPKAPLGIPDNGYDLATLSIEPIDDNRRTYERMLEEIDGAMAQLWERMLDSEEAPE
ncbi:MAG: hypothetical protein ACHQ50_08555 [Fimbriimonadales bacterium]